MTFCDPPGDDGAVGGCAQMMGAPPPQAIGKIQTATGPVTVMDARGAVAQVKVGDPVYRHDTIETGADGAVGITFIDGTAFNLSNNARMALNEFVCDGTSNSALFRLSKGAFSFINGKVAKAGGLRIETPFARLRGAAQDGGIGILTLAALAFSTIREIQAASRSDAFLDDRTITYKDSPHGTFEITTRDGRVIVADDPGETVVVDPAGSVTRIPNSSSRMAELQQAQQNTLATLSLGIQQGAAPGGSSTPTTFDSPQQFQPIKFSLEENHSGAAVVTTITTATSSGFTEVPQLQLKLPPPPSLPTIAINSIPATGQIGIAADNLINASKANAGVDITGTTSGVEDGRVVTITVVDSFGRVVYSSAATVTNGTWSINVSSTDAKLLADGTYTVKADVSNAAGTQAQAFQAVTVDETAPTVTVAGSSPTLKAGQTDTITFTFSEAVTGFDNASVSVTGGTLGAITQVNDTTYMAVFTPAANFHGTGSVQVVAGGWTDKAGNPGLVLASNTLSTTEDTELPTVAVTGNSPTLKAGQTDTITFTFSEAVTGFDNADVSVTGGTLGTITQVNATTFTAVFTPAAGVDTQTATIQVVASGTGTSSWTDALGNPGLASNTLSITEDTKPPTVTINKISPDSGSSASDGVTNVAVVTVSGTTEANSTVKLFDGGNQAGTATADSSGNWSVTNVTLSEGVNNLTATATDAAGNVSAVSATFVATLDQDIGEQLTVNLSGLTGGHAVEDQTVTAIVTDADNDVPTSGITYAWQVSHDGGNTWSTVGGNTRTYTPGEADEGGLLKVLVSFTDAAGNTESGSSTVGVLPLLTIADNSLLVSPNGSVLLGISLTQEPTPDDDPISVTISFPSSGAHDPTIAAGDHATGNPHTSGGITTYTFSVADVNSGLTFTNHGDPVDTLTVKEVLNGNTVATSQTITVTDPPVSGGGAIVSDQPVSATGEDASVQSTPDSALLFKDFAQNYGNNLLHPPAQPENDGVQTVTDGAHPAHPHSDVAQFSDFKSADDASAHLARATGKDTSVQAPPADNGHHANVDPEINLASIAPNHLPDHPADNLPHISAQLDANELRAVTDGAYPAYPHSDVNQLASFKFADDGSAHPGMVPYGLLTVTPLSSDSSGTHGPTALALANTANVPGTVLSDAALDKFIFAENVGHDTVAGHRPDMTEIDHTVPADIQHLLGTAHETNMVSTLDPNHTIAQDMTKVLPHHQSDFHFA